MVTNLTAKYIVQSVQSCSQATFHCVQLWRRIDNVLQIKIGKVAPNTEDACHEQLFFDSSLPIHTITSESTLCNQDWRWWRCWWLRWLMWWSFWRWWKW